MKYQVPHQNIEQEQQQKHLHETQIVYTPNTSNSHSQFIVFCILIEMKKKNK